DRAPDACRASRRRRRYRRHGFYRLKATLRELGPRTIDRRTSLGKALAAWKAELEADLGGAANLSMQERTLVDVLVRQKVLLDSLDAWVFVQPSLVNARRREVVRVVRDRQVIVDSIARLMGQLGLKRRAVDGGDASRALLEVKRLREAAAETARDA